MIPIRPHGPAEISSAQLGKEIKVSAQRLCRWRRDGFGPKFSKRGHNVFYKRADVVDWFEGERGNAALGSLGLPYWAGYEAAKAGAEKQACPHMSIVGEFCRRTAWIAGWWQWHDEQGKAA